MAMSGAFHMRLASSAHNTAIESLAHGFYGNMVSSLRQAQNVAPVMGHVGTQEHLAVVEAIAARNVEAATSVMSRHLHRTEERVRSAHSESVHTD
jgi:GntR family transcriptional repressor for pyruvate dehydrogenase complex